MRRITRTLVLSNMYPPHHLGGYELSCRDVVDRLRARGHEVSVLTTTMRVPGVADPDDERAAHVWRDLDFYFRDADLWAPPVWRRATIERHNQTVLRQAIARTRPEVVSVWHMGAMSMGLLTTLVDTGIPLVYAVCDDWLCYGPDVDAWMRLWRRPRLARAAERLFGVPAHLPDVGASGTFCFVSELTRRRSEDGSRWTYPDATVVYSGIDRRDFPPVRDAPARPWAWRLLYVGRLDPRKGIETLVRALVHLPDAATVDVVGRGNDEYRARLDDLTRDLGVEGRVRFSSCGREELAARYRASDVVVFPSEWPEPFGLVPVEAMACDVPVVATGVGGSAEFLVDGGNCVRFTAGDPRALAAAVVRLADDEALRDAVVRGGRHTAEELDVERLADTFEAWHDAAARHFADGRPPDRRPPTPPAPAP